MRRPGLFLCLLSMVLIFFLVAPVNAESSTISSFTPTVVYQGTAPTITITGSNFNTTSVTVKIMNDDYDNVTTTATSLTSTEIVCKFTSSKLTSIGTGDWHLVVVNPDESEVKSTSHFSVKSAITLTSITPTKARANNDSVSFALTGTGLADIASVYLYNSDYTNITASDVDPTSSTKVTGIFDLTDANIDTYYVYVKDSAGTRKYDSAVTFAVTSDAVGSIDLASSPTGASVLLDGTLKGTTPITIDDLDVGSYKLIIKKDGYSDWARTAKVTNGGTTSFDAVLEAKTVATTAPTAVPTTAPTTVKTTRVSTIAVPTKWVDTPTTTPASPLEGAVIIGAIGIGIIAIRRKD